MRTETFDFMGYNLDDNLIYSSNNLTKSCPSLSGSVLCWVLMEQQNELKLDFLMGKDTMSTSLMSNIISFLNTLDIFSLLYNSTQG